MKKKKIKVPGSKKKSVAATQTSALKVKAETKKPNIAMIVFFTLFAIFVVAEVYFMSAKHIRQSKKPAYLNQWQVKYTGYTSSGEYGAYLYVTDNSRGDVYKTDKATGNTEKMLSFTEGAVNAVADSKGDIYVLNKTNEVSVVDGKTYKTVKKIKLEGVSSASWIDVDSNDNFFIANNSNATIFKFGPDFKKIAVFGGTGDGKESFRELGKIFVSPKNEVHALDAGDTTMVMIRIFDNNGKFLRAWKISNVVKYYDALTQIAIMPNGNVYINSYRDGKIYVFTSSGKFLGSFDEDTNKRFQIINGAVSICGGKEGTFFVFTHQIFGLKEIKY